MLNKPSSRSLRPILRACGLLVGMVVLTWRYRAPWCFALCGIAGSMVFVAAAAPASYAPIERGFERLQTWFVQAFSWVLLLTIFLLIFTPGRLIMGLAGDRRFGRIHKKNTYWTASAPILKGYFDRQF